LTRDNNFDFLRIVAAVFVIVTHSYDLSGINEHDLLNRLSKNTLCFSHLGVAMFFVLSGFLIIQSAENTKGFYQFMVKRLLRILPGLFCALVLSIFILGPIVTDLALSTYFANPDTYMHLVTLTLYNIRHLNLPGVFENNPINAVNGSLWTLSYEFTFYLIVSFVIYFSKMRKEFRPWLVLICYIILLLVRLILGNRLYWYNYSTPYLFQLNIMYLLEWSIYFSSGVLIFYFKEKLPIFIKTIFPIAVAYFLSYYLNYIFILKFLHYILIPLICFSIAFKISKVQIPTFIGDPSYGLYIYAFPIQQTLIHFYPKINLIVYTILSIFVTLFLAIISWKVIEKKALSLKRYF